MDKIFAKDLHEKDAVDTIFLVARKTAVTGKPHPFIALTLRDRTGDLDARIWEDVDSASARFDKGDFVHVQGHVLQYKNRLQIKVDTLEKVDASQVQAADYAEPPRPAEGDRAIAQIRDLAGRIQDPNLQALVQSFLNDESVMEPLRTMAAARSIHHSAPGGLAEHTLSVMKLALSAADQYPMADRDLLLAGAFLHDLGKLHELKMADRQAEYTDEGRFLGHLVIGARMLRERCASLKGFPPALEMHLEHIVLAHHGTLEFGSPRLPQTLEAIIVHYLDDLDSKVGALMEICQRDPAANERWTDFQKQYNRYFYKGATPTIHGKYAFESKKRRAQERRSAAEKARQETAGKNAKAASESTNDQGTLNAAAPLTQPTAPLAAHGEPKARIDDRPQKPQGAEQPRRGHRDSGERRSGTPSSAGRPGAAKLSFKPFEALAAALGEAAASQKDPDAPAADAAQEKTALETLAETVGAAMASAVRALTDEPVTAAETPSVEAAPEPSPESADDGSGSQRAEGQAEETAKPEKV